MRTSLAWCNVIHDRRRTLAAVAGVAFAILLVFMQLGFYTGCKTSATMLYDAFDFDAILLSKTYVHLRLSYSIPRIRVSQASGVPGVASVVPVYVSTALWRHVETQVNRELLVFAVNPDDRPCAIDEINRSLPLLKEPDTAIMDQVAKPLIGPHPVGTITEVNGRRVKVVADYCRGTGLIADGALWVSDVTLSNLLGCDCRDQIQLGLVRFAPGANREEVLERIRARLPEDTLVWTREKLRGNEQYFFLHIKPVGFLFTSGLYVGFLVGAVILYQVLSADIAKHIRQYATLKAMGYGPGHLCRVVIAQGLLFGVLAFCPATVISLGIYALVRKLADLPMYLTLPRAGLVFGLSVGMCIAAGLFVIRKVNAADPADLF